MSDDADDHRRRQDDLDALDDLDPAELLRSLDRRPSTRWRAVAVLALVGAAVLTVDAVWRAARHGEWIRLPGVPVAVLVAVVAASHAWERSEPDGPGRTLRR